MTAFVGIVSLAVDWGNTQLAKTELQAAADAAARAGAAGLTVRNGDWTVQRIAYGESMNPEFAVSHAKKTAFANESGGKGITLVDGRPENGFDLEVGEWKNERFYPLQGQAQLHADAVRVVARRAARRGTEIRTPFASVIGFDSADAKAEAIARVIPAIYTNQRINGNASPFLAGMPEGTITSRINPSDRKVADVAGDIRWGATDPRIKNSPLPVTSLPIVEGTALTFDTITGQVTYDPSADYSDPDGNASLTGHNNLTTSRDSQWGGRFYNENGIADAMVPLTAVVGVFLDDSRPDLTPAPENLDFSTPASRNFDKLQPKLKQIFFIGDGLNNDKNVRQQFIVPQGATRLYIATWDHYEWNNNQKHREVKVERPQQIITVK
jgi:Flp pilus assembly protein TadG